MTLDEIKASAAEQSGPMPPHSTEAEQGMLGCILLAPADSLGTVIERFRDTSDICYDLRHQTMLDVMFEMFDAKEAIDVITFQQRMKDKQLMEQVGGIQYILEIQDSVPSAANLPYYLDIIESKVLYRRTVKVCTEAVSEAYANPPDPVKFMDSLEAGVLAIRTKTVGAEKSIRGLVVSAYNTIEELHKSKGAITGLSTGFPDIDKMTNGLRRGAMWVIAARPSVGKTSMAMNIAEHVAVDSGIPTGVFSLEMPAEDLVLRMVTSRSRMKIDDWRTGVLTEHDFKKMAAEGNCIAKAPLFIDDTPGLSIMQLRSKARRMHQKRGIKLLVIDYLQLLHSTNKKADNRQQEITDISAGIKGISRELNIPVIVLSQLNREIEKDKNRKPRLSDLRESGSIEQDADLVGLLYRPADEAETDRSYAQPVRLMIAKQRNGPISDGRDIELVFIKPLTRFESTSKVTA